MLIVVEWQSVNGVSMLSECCKVVVLELYGGMIELMIEPFDGSLSNLYGDDAGVCSKSPICRRRLLKCALATFLLAAPLQHMLNRAGESGAPYRSGTWSHSS